MMLYTCDFGWSGAITIVAENLKEAKIILEKTIGRRLHPPIKEHKIVNGLVVEFHGDS